MTALQSPWWYCARCGFANRPRVVPNSLNALPADHKLFDRQWRELHCEQCGAERGPEAQEYAP